MWQQAEGHRDNIQGQNDARRRQQAVGLCFSHSPMALRWGCHLVGLTVGASEAPSSTMHTTHRHNKPPHLHASPRSTQKLTTRHRNQLQAQYLPQSCPRAAPFVHLHHQTHTASAMRINIPETQEQPDAPVFLRIGLVSCKADETSFSTTTWSETCWGSVKGEEAPPGAREIVHESDVARPRHLDEHENQDLGHCCSLLRCREVIGSLAQQRNPGLS